MRRVRLMMVCWLNGQMDRRVLFGFWVYHLNSMAVIATFSVLAQIQPFDFVLLINPQHDNRINHSQNDEAGDYCPANGDGGKIGSSKQISRATQVPPTHALSDSVSQ